MECPKCKSSNVTVVTDTKGKGGGFNWCLGILGFLIFPLCALCGIKKAKITTEHLLICMDCGHKSKIK